MRPLIIALLLVPDFAFGAPHINRCCWQIRRDATLTENVEGGTAIVLVLGGFSTFVIGFFARAPAKVMIPALSSAFIGTLLGWHSDGAFEKGNLYKCRPDPDCLGMSWMEQQEQKP